MASASEIETFMIETSRNIRNLIYSKESKEIIDKVKGKDVVILMGMTKCGKSVIVNYLLGNKLVANKTQKNKFNIDKEDSSSDGPAIGLSSVSETKIPTIWKSTKINELIADCPGFDDNRGVVQDIASAFYIREIIVNAKTVKLIFMADINDILNQSIRQFINFLDITNGMLPKSNQINHGMVLVLTKDNENMTSADIGELLNEKIINVPTIQVQNRQFVERFQKNVNNIVVTRMPNKAGVVDEKKVFNNLIEVLNKTDNLSYRDLLPVRPGISAKSKVFLLESHRYLSELQEFENVLDKIHGALKDKLQKYKPHSDSDKKTLSSLRKNVVDLEEEILRVDGDDDEGDGGLYRIANFRKIAPNVSELNEGSDLFMKLQIVSFVDSVLNIKESGIFNVKIDTLISKMKTDIRLMFTDIIEKLQEVTDEEYKNRLKEIQKENDDMVSEKKKELSELETTQAKLKQTSASLGLIFQDNLDTLANNSRSIQTF